MDEKQYALQKVVMDVQCYPALPESYHVTSKTQTFPLAEVSGLGAGFAELIKPLQSMSAGGEGLYRCVFPNGVAGTLAEFKDGSGYLGSIMGDGIEGQARWIPAGNVPIDPVTLCIAAAVMDLKKTLNEIKETQQEMLEYTINKDKSKLTGNLRVLEEIANNYNSISLNDIECRNRHKQVLDIKRDTEASVDFYQRQIQSKLDKKKFISTDNDTAKLLDTVKDGLQDYQLSLYMLSFSTLLDVMLSKNFEKTYIENMADKIREYSYDYRDLYTKAYDRIEEISQKSIQNQLMNGVGFVSKAAGKTVEKIPVISKTQLDENLIKVGNNLKSQKYKRTNATMLPFTQHKSALVQPFIENLKLAADIYNKPMLVTFDSNNLYLNTEQEEWNTILLA